ncbi:hypothetical protein D1872_300110 [compost metagenome]
MALLMRSVKGKRHVRFDQIIRFIAFRQAALFVNDDGHRFGIGHDGLPVDRILQGTDAAFLHQGS